MCSTSYNAMQVHYLFIQFAHTIRQLLDFVSKSVISFPGKIKEISFSILNKLISTPIYLIECLNFQLRFDILYHITFSSSYAKRAIYFFTLYC